MKRTLNLLILCAALWLGAAGVAAAQQPQNIAVVDIARIMRESAATKSITTQIEKQRNAYQQEITKQENDLRAAEQELNRQRTIISPEAFAERRRAFEQRVGNLQRDVQNRKRELDKALGTATVTVQNALRDIIGGMVTERKYTLILIKTQTAYNAPDMEITEDVLKRLNAKLPSVKVPPPGGK